MKKIKYKYAGPCWKCESCEDYEAGICTLVNKRIKEMIRKSSQAMICIAYQPKRKKENE